MIIRHYTLAASSNYGSLYLNSLSSVPLSLGCQFSISPRSDILILTGQGNQYSKSLQGSARQIIPLPTLFFQLRNFLFFFFRGSYQLNLFFHGTVGSQTFLNRNKRHLIQV